MSTKYAHTNIISKDWKRLVDFYIKVFDCVPVPPERDQSGDLLERGTGVKGASLKGMHLRLPGHGNDGPTLEVYTYGEMIEGPAHPLANRKGIGHLAFEVDNVEETVQHITEEGGSLLGEIVSKEVKGVGEITFVYITDPEGNIIEVQSWDLE